MYRNFAAPARGGPGDRLKRETHAADVPWVTRAQRASSDDGREHALLWGLGSGRKVRALLREGLVVEVLAIDVDPQRGELARAIVDACPQLSQAQREGRLQIMVAPAEQLAAHFSVQDHVAAMHVDHAALQRVPSAARELARMIDRLTAERADLRRFAPRLHANLRDNLAVLAKASSLASWRDAARGRPGFVLAAGPSARAALPWLADARAHGPVIAVDTCLPMLQSAKLGIDVLASVDPHPASRVHLQHGCDGVTALALQPYCAPEVAAAFTRHVLALPAGDRLCDRVAAQTDLPALPVAGTVLLFALQIAALLGCDPIVIAGADFAHVGGLSHAEGTATSRALPASGVLVPDRRGLPIASSTSLLRFKGDVEQHIAASTTRHIVVDGGGAAIAGVRTVEPAAIARWARRSTAAFTLRAPPEPDELQIARQQRMWRQLLAEFDVT